MAKQRLFPETEDKRDPRKRFEDAAAKIFALPKPEIDEREKEWRESKSTRPARPRRT